MTDNNSTHGNTAMQDKDKKQSQGQQTNPSNTVNDKDKANMPGKNS